MMASQRVALSGQIRPDERFQSGPHKKYRPAILSLKALGLSNQPAYPTHCTFCGKIYYEPLHYTS